MKRPTKIAVAGVLATALIVGLVFAFLPKDSRTPGVTGTFELGPATQIAGTAIGTDGGTIQIQNETSSLNGMTITAPQGAYTEPVNFAVSESAIISSTFGEDFTPVTPLIMIDNGEVFAGRPLEVKIPIDIEDDEFAMGFYYDAETGTLEGIPFSELTNDSITLVTCHFSYLSILKVDVKKIEQWAQKGINSGFRPGHDDFSADNYGSIVAPGGHCRGQNMAELYYYINLKSVTGENLYWLLDNNGLNPETPEFWYDDTKAVRLSSYLQSIYERTDNPLASLDKLYADSNYDLQTYYGIAYAMKATGRPQLLGIYAESGGHSLIAYKVLWDEVYVSDPNYTGKVGDSQAISLNRFASGGPRFLPYYSALSADYGKGTPFYWFQWWGLSALHNPFVAAQAWEDTLRDGGVVNAAFPPDPQVIACLGWKEDPLYGAVLDEVPISDGLTVSLTKLDELAVNGGGRLYCRYDLTYQPASGQQRIRYYVNGDWGQQEGLPQPGMPDGYHYVQLKPGENDVGLLYEVWYIDPEYDPNDPKSVDRSGWRYVNYYHYTIYYDDGTTEVPETTTAVGETTTTVAETTTTVAETTTTIDIAATLVPMDVDSTGFVLVKYAVAVSTTDQNVQRVFATFTDDYTDEQGRPRRSLSVWEYTLINGQAVYEGTPRVYGIDVPTEVSEEVARMNAEAAAAIALRMGEEGLTEALVETVQ